MQISISLKIRKIAQLQETIVFNCNPITNAHHELPKGIYNPNQDRKFGSSRFAAFLTSLLRNTFAKWPHLNKPSFDLKITVKCIQFKIIDWPPGWPQSQVLRAYLSTPAMRKTDSTFPAFSLRIVDFEVQVFPSCKFSFHEERHSSQVWQWRDLPKPITILCQRIATNDIASFCVDHRWRQMAFFHAC